MVLNLQREIYY